MVDAPIPPAEVLNQQRDLVRLEALESIAASKLSIKQALELAELHELYGTTYERKLKVALTKFNEIIAGPRFQVIREWPSQDVLRRQLDDLDGYRLPERIALLTPADAQEIRGTLTNRLVTVSGLRRHAARSAGVLDGLVTLASELWMGLSPADREWRMLGETAAVLDDMRTKARDVKSLAEEADRVYWDLKSQLETIVHIMYDWDRSMNKGAAERERAKQQDDNDI